MTGADGVRRTTRRRRLPVSRSRVAELERQGYRIVEWVTTGGRLRVNMVTRGGQTRTREVVTS